MVSSYEYLANVYQLDSLEGWHLLGRHFELTDGFSFVVVLAPDNEGVSFLRGRIAEILPTGKRIHRVIFDPRAPEGSLAQALMELPPLATDVHAVWVDTEPTSPELIPEQNRAWAAGLDRLNRYRNSLQERIKCTLVIAGAMNLQTILREHAPDFWSIRSGVFRMEPIGSSRVMLLPEKANDGELIGGDPEITLAEAEKLRGKPGRELLFARLLQRAGTQAQQKLQWERAIKCFEEACEIEEKHGGDPRLRFEITLDLATLFEHLANYNRASHFAELGVRLAKAHFDTESEEYVRATATRAKIIEESGQLNEAERLFRHALAISERIHGLDHENTAALLNNLASVLEAKGNHNEASILLRRAVEIAKSVYGNNHPNLATALGNLGISSFRANNKEEAERLLRQALEINEKEYGPNHPAAARSISNLSQLLRNSQKFEEAELLMRRALAIDASVYGENHPITAVRLNNLGTLLDETMRHDEAIPMLRQALEINKNSYGPNHPDTGESLNNLGISLQSSGQLDQAEPLLRQSINILINSGKSNGYINPNLRIALSNYIELLLQMKKSFKVIREAIENLGPEAIKIVKDSGEYPHIFPLTQHHQPRWKTRKKR